MTTWRVAIAVAALLAGGTAARAEDDGAVCGRAPSAQGEALQAVIQACSKIERGQKTKPDLARVLRYRGMAEQRSGNLPAAIADFNRTLELTPDDTWAIQGRAEAHEALGHDRRRDHRLPPHGGATAGRHALAHQDRRARCDAAGGRAAEARGGRTARHAGGPGRGDGSQDQDTGSSVPLRLLPHRPSRPHRHRRSRAPIIRRR